ncbi:MAG: sigma-54-dependent Fis family transcriptional regulator, partial [Planctomycetales bacterium]|nr:sigma-54-dependent Fis family transcriptional regulator [Planctomycetales bacterium]
MPTLLVIDDEPNVRYSLENALRSDTVDVLTAPTARQGVHLVREQSPDAVLLDVRLPDKSGLDAFSEIQEIDPQLPVIMMTAFTTTDTAIEAMKRGAFDYLTKPVDLKQLRGVVSKAIDLRQMTLSPPDLEPQLDVQAESVVGRSATMQD